MSTPSLSRDSCDTPRTEVASPTAAHENDASIYAQPPQLQPHQSLPRPSSRRVKTPTKLTKLKSGLPTPPRLRRPRSSHVGNSGNERSGASNGPVHSGNTLESYVVPKNLRMSPDDVNFVMSGMEVVKVSKVGCMFLV